MEIKLLDSLWVLVCTALVFMMQGGFLCLETGLTRGKDAINVSLKNMTDFSMSIVMYWAFGFAIMFGVSQSGWIGTSNFFFSVAENGSSSTTIFLFHAMFCATAATIVSGAIAGRMHFVPYLFTVIIVSGLIYPVFGHWAWGGEFAGGKGWLAASGFVDFAGSAVVHTIGGSAALAAVIVLGPRIGRFDEGKTPREIPGSDPPMMMFGALLLWIGWIGFNGGSTLAMNDAVSGIVLNTILAGAAGMLAGLGVGWYRRGCADIGSSVNGSLAGLVAITAGCHAVTAPAALIIGMIGAIVMLAAERILIRCRVDDVVGAIQVHACAGVWGVIAVALFGNLETLGTGLSRWDQLQIQSIGALVSAVGAFGVTYVLLRAINRVVPLRVTAEEEFLGLNIVEHGVETELHKLVSEMNVQQQSGDFSEQVSVESFSEIGKIAEQYNMVLAVINSERRELVESSHQAAVANTDLRQAQHLIEQKLHELAEFNDVAVDRELRMIELKHEINRLCEQAGVMPRYEMDFVSSGAEAVS